MDNDTQHEILSITNTKEENSKREGYNHRNEVEYEKENNIRSKKVVISLNNLLSTIKSNKQYICINDDDLDNDNIEYKSISITNIEDRNSKKEKHDHKKKVDKNKIQEEPTLKHIIVNKRVNVSQKLDNQREKKEKEDKDKVYNVNEKKRFRNITFNVTRFNHLSSNQNPNDELHTPIRNP